MIGCIVVDSDDVIVAVVLFERISERAEAVEVGNSLER